ncbi:MAG: hypothetical protein VYE68_01585 [Acidobacteriota bacterium]|nr:hypothetical protein [Acidobacteriota bacterium]
MPQSSLLLLMLVVAALRLGNVSRRARTRDTGTEASFMNTVVEQAVSRLRDEERATHARATEFGRLNEEIIAGLTSGLLVVGANDQVRILNPAGRAADRWSG